MADVPHLSWPLRYDSMARRLAQVEQDSIEDVRQNVHSYLATERGERPLSPDFGLEDPTFGPGVNGQALAAAIMEVEERADVTVAVEQPDAGGRASITVHVELVE